MESEPTDRAVRAWVDDPAVVLAEVSAIVESEEHGELLDEASAILVAEQSRQTWADRLAFVEMIRVDVAGMGSLTGSPDTVGRDVLCIRLTGSRNPVLAILPASAVLALYELPSRLADEARRDERSAVVTWSLGQLLRVHLGWPCAALLRDSSRVDGRLAQVGADHLDLLPTGDGPGEGTRRTLPFTALAGVLVSEQGVPRLSSPGWTAGHCIGA